MWTITANVEFKGAVHLISFTSRSDKWQLVKPEYRDDRARTIAIPDDQFRSDKIVEDVAIGHYDGQDVSWYEAGVRPDHSQGHENSIVVVLESPHKDEYDPSFQPLEPLTGSRRVFRAHLPSVLREISRRVQGLRGIVVLSNPVQYQASLARILDSEKIVPAIRDAMWKELYGIARIRQDFLGRLRSYEPRVVINACTAKVKPQITEDILQSGIAIAAHIVETGHPSLWVFPANRSLTWRTVV